MTNDLHRILDQWQDLIMNSVAEQDFYNDAATRQHVVSSMNAHLGSLEQISDYLITCDERNNTAYTIEQNSLIVDITLAFVCTEPVDVRFTIEPEPTMIFDECSMITHDEDDYDWLSLLASNPYLWDGEMDEPAEPDFLAITRDIANGA